MLGLSKSITLKTSNNIGKKRQWTTIIVYRRTRDYRDNSVTYCTITKETRDSRDFFRIEATTEEEYEQHRNEPASRKTRHYLRQPYSALLVDEFQDSQKNCLAEFDIKDNQPSKLRMVPNWLGIEVTNKPEYTSLCIAKHGFPANQLSVPNRR
jgi:CYTH domain-containing protein